MKLELSSSVEGKTVLSCLVIMTKGCPVLDCALSVDSSGASVSICSEEDESIDGVRVTAGNDVINWEGTDDGIKVSGLKPEPSLPAKVETVLSFSVMMINGCPVLDSALSVDSSVAPLFVSSEEAVPTVGDTVTADDKITDKGETDDGIKVSGVNPELSSVKRESVLSFSVMTTNGCLELDSVLSVDSPVNSVFVSSEEAELIVEDRVTAGIKVTDKGVTEDEIKISEVKPEPSLSSVGETVMSSSVMMTNGCPVLDSVLPIDSSVYSLSVSAELTVGDTVTAGIEVTDEGEIDDGIKVSGVNPEPSSTMVEENILSCSVIMTNGCPVLDVSDPFVSSLLSV